MSSERSSTYPAGPASTPPGYIQPSRAYKRNAWLAVAGLVGFFLLYLGATAWFGWKAFRLAGDAQASRSMLGAALAALAAFLFVFLAKALLPNRRTPRPERVELTAEEHPTLFAFVNRIADDANAPRPRRVYVTPEVNAAVFYEVSLLSLILPARKNLLIGIGLVNVLTLAEFKAVLAHEFGHFAQRAMAVGRWVYIGQQVAARIIARRDAVDRLVDAVASADIRIAWLGWGLRILGWAIRALTESFFHLVILAERALSREMELQADRVAVSLAGSDALTHALFRLQAADTAWGQAEVAAAAQLNRGFRVPDLFALQTQALGELRRIFGDREFGDVPPLPDDPSGHRIFTPALAQPPVMWSTHPASHDREANAKEPYIAADLDDRSAWLLFEDPALLRRRLSQRELDRWGAAADAQLLEPEEALDRAEERFDKGFLEARYHGLYLGREVTRHAPTVAGLYGPPPQGEQSITSALTDAYPEPLAELVRADRELREEKAQLEALEAGIADAPGRSIQHRGRTLERKELRQAIGAVRVECSTARAKLHEVDRGLRAAHWAAANTLGRDWADLHGRQLALLHFAEHVEANLRDAMGMLNNVFAVVTADGRVTGAEMTRLVAAATELYFALQQVPTSRELVVLGPAVAAWMEAESWDAAIGEPFALHPPSRDNIDDWLSVVESWYDAYVGMLGQLGGAALEGLLDIEAHIRRCWCDGRELGPVPDGPSVNAEYRPFVEGDERPLQTKLGWWDRFVTADGWGPGAARLGVATTVVGIATFGGVGGGLATPDVTVHNGLNRDVVVRSGDETVTVAAASTATLELDIDAPQIEARTVSGELIEAFDHEVTSAFGDYGYSVAAAVPLVEWTVVYGAGRPDADRQLGALRWYDGDADYVFEEPPSSMSSNDGSAYRTAVSAVDVVDLTQMMIALSLLSEEEQARVALAHARWDELPMGALWLSVAHRIPGAEQGAAGLLEQRRAALATPDVLLERAAQDMASDGPDAGDGMSAVCARHDAWSKEEPDNPDALYLALRCGPEDEDNAVAVARAHEAHPQHAWLTVAAGFAYYRLGSLDVSVELLGEARQALPHMQEMLALFEARVLRLGAAVEGAVDSDAVENASIQARMMWARERGDEGVALSFRHLARGRLNDAVRLAGDDLQRALILRLAATSTGATDSIMANAAKLDSTTEMGTAEAVAGLVVALRTGGDAAPFEAVIRERAGRDADTVLAYADAKRLENEREALETARRWLDPELRGHAAVLGIGVLGEDAPEQWRAEARRLLFVGERPFLGTEQR